MNENEQKISSPDGAVEQSAGQDNENIDAAKQAAYAIVKPVRTFERDIAESIRKNDASVASINVMEQKRREEKKLPDISEKTEKFAWGSVAVLTSIVLVVAAVGVFGLLFFAYKNKPAPAATPQYSVISTDEVKKIDVTGVNRQELVKLFRENLEKSGAERSLTEIMLFEKIAVDAGFKERQISSEQFMSLVAQNAPPSLSRAFEGPWVLGFYNGDNPEPFILANIGSFDNAFDGMIKWESEMALDLEKMFLERERAVGTTTQEFEDFVIKSKNVRALKDNRDNTVLLYSFLNDKYIVITVNEEVFKEVLNRFLTSKLVR